MDNWWVYIVEKRTGLYVGITTDLENRMRQHGQPTPLHCEGPIPKADALRREKPLKAWSKKKKLELIERQSLEPSEGSTSGGDRSIGDGIRNGIES